MQHVCSTENEFLAAPPATRHNRHGYRVNVGDKVFYVWAGSSVQAMGLVAKEAELMTATSYRPKEVRHHESIEIDSKLVAAVTSLDTKQQEKLRVILRHGFRDGLPSNV